MCDFSPPLGDVDAAGSDPGSPVAGSVQLDFGDTPMTASTAITLDSTSIVYVGYTNTSGTFVGVVRNLSQFRLVQTVYLHSSFKSSSTSLPPHFYLSLGIHSTRE